MIRHDERHGVPWVIRHDEWNLRFFVIARANRSNSGNGGN
jgi:hypothetical protein